MSMLPIGIFGCFVPVLMLGLAAFCIRTLWIALVPPSKMPRDAACGRCGYSVAGLSTPSCPECGADWRIAGITTPALIMRYRGGTGGAILAWTILMGGGALVLVGIIGIWGSRQVVSTITTTPQTWTTPMSPASKAYSGVDVESTMIMGGPGAPTSVRLVLSPLSGGPWSLDVSPTARTATITGPATGTDAGPSAYGPGSVAAFYRVAGLDTENSAIAAEARELESVVDVLLISPYTQPSQMTLNSFIAGPASFSGMTSVTSGGAGSFLGPLITVLAGALVCLVLYIAGIIFIVKRRKSLMGRFAAQAVYSPGM